MGYDYGIQIARQALLKLSADEKADARLSDAMSEIEVIEKGDVSPEHFDELQSLIRHYRNRDDGTASKEQVYKSFADRLVWLACDISVANGKQST